MALAHSGNVLCMPSWDVPKSRLLPNAGDEAAPRAGVRIVKLAERPWAITSALLAGGIWSKNVMSHSRRSIVAGLSAALLLSAGLSASPVAAQELKEVRIGLQKAGIFPAVKARGTLEKALKSRGILPTLIQTRERFNELQQRLIARMVDEQKTTLGDELMAQAQCALDILVRNLYERTADVGFLATDDVVLAFCSGDTDYQQAHRAAKVKSGECDLAVGGGIESMSRVPMGSGGGTCTASRGPEWWRHPRGYAPGNGSLTRDYYHVEDNEGRRFWLFRRGLYDEIERPLCSYSFLRAASPPSDYVAEGIRRGQRSGRGHGRHAVHEVSQEAPRREPRTDDLILLPLPLGGEGRGEGVAPDATS
eukprot:gene1439-1917_t